MLSIEVSVNIFLLVFAMGISAWVGYSLRTRQLRKKQFKIVELRKEMVDNHAQILDLQKEYVQLESRFQASSTAPVLKIQMIKQQEMQETEVLDSAI